MKTLVNVVLYQLIWFLCVLGGDKGALAAVPLLLVHLALSSSRRSDLQLMCFVLFLGVLVDGTLQHVGFFTFTNPGFPIPLWLMVVWLGMAIMPHHSLAWMKSRPFLWVLFGAFGGPAAYWAGARLGAASFSWPLLQALPLLAVIWAFTWSLVMYFSVLVQEDGRGNDRRSTGH